MKETRSDIEVQLAHSRDRLADLEQRGADALSDYDKKIAYGGNIEKALRMSKELVGNHIRYFTEKLEQLPPEQSKLF